jgi:signal transduction histidine kinase
LNLGINAIEAMPGGGTMTFRTRSVGQGVAIEVEDAGVGIADDAIEHIFDPFFTTKDRGSGLGLSIAHKIITHHDGTIVATGQRQGTLFTITLDGTP